MHVMSFVDDAAAMSLTQLTHAGCDERNSPLLCIYVTREQQRQRLEGTDRQQRA